ncbi:hypothetical protein ACLB2K_067460 [Fragaria x ananassa]
MASHFILKLANPFPLALLLVFAMSTSALSSQASVLKETRMVLYFQDFSGGPNATSIPIAGIAGKLWTFTQFGTVYVTDDTMTEGPSRKSAIVGRVQGMTVAVALDGSNALVLVSLVFTNREYNGSTIEIQGNSKQFQLLREVAVVSGTGKFSSKAFRRHPQRYVCDIWTGNEVLKVHGHASFFELFTATGDAGKCSHG